MSEFADDRKAKADRNRQRSHAERLPVRTDSPLGRNFHPGFRPELTPKEMLELGVFSGKCMTDTRKEFPAPWFKPAKLSPHSRDCSINCYGVDASGPLSVWRKKG